jgi:cyclopropane fatty-acyl-phospholipid synthase-like methyltransferase
MAWGVVEHVPNQELFLKKVNSLLKPGGIFVSEVPHGNSLLVDYTRKTGIDPERIIMGEQDIVLFSIEAYRGLHTNAGLHQLHLQTNGLDFSTILNLNGASLDDVIIEKIQDIIDEKLYGDLLRGFWTK